MNYKLINDYELIYLVKEKDDFALQMIIDKYSPIISKISGKYYKRFKEYGISYDDLIQECRIHLIKVINSYNQDCTSLLYSYIILCIERHLISYCRSYMSKKNYVLNSNIEIENLYYNFSTSKDFTFDFMYEKELFLNIKNSLTLNNSIVFELKYNCFSINEISVLLDLPISTVKGRLNIIKKSVKNSLNFIF